MTHTCQLPTFKRIAEFEPGAVGEQRREQHKQQARNTLQELQAILKGYNGAIPQLTINKAI
jgi:predicted component of type VI protein secretion system